jgi:hypothetical protein
LAARWTRALGRAGNWLVTLGCACGRFGRRPRANAEVSVTVLQKANEFLVAVGSATLGKDLHCSVLGMASAPIVPAGGWEDTLDAAGAQRRHCWGRCPATKLRLLVAVRTRTSLGRLR